MDSELEQLRKILLGADYDDLLQLKEEMRDSETFAEVISKVITEAIQAREQRDDSVAEVLAPTIDHIITSSIDQDPHRLAESLYPIMGPAIRKSISETLQQMLENFNQLLEQSLSPRSLKWRFDAWRTGRNYSELVLLNTLEYQIEQVFLIHRETSLLIQHVFSEFAEKKDPDMVSSMFSAIQDFIEDSFSVSEGDVLDTLRLGELSVVIQRGPLAAIAAVVRGRIPEDLRNKLQISLEQLHRVKRDSLTDYAGDPSVFAESEDDLRGLLEFKQKSKDEEREIPWLALGALMIAFIVGGYFYYESTLRADLRQQLVVELDQMPGIIVIASETGDRSFRLSLLRDPMAVVPENIISRYPADIGSPEIVEYRYLSSDDNIIEQRAVALLAPEVGTDLRVEDGILIVSGESTVQWNRMMEQSWNVVTGLSSMRRDNLVLDNPILDLVAARVQDLQMIRYEFEKSRADIDETDPQLLRIEKLISEINNFQKLEGLPEVTMDIVGYTDESGTRDVNEKLGLQRAEALKVALIKLGVDGRMMQTLSSFDYPVQLYSDARQVRIFVKQGAN